MEEVVVADRNESVVYFDAVMSLRDFVQAATKDIQDPAARKAAATEQSPPQEKAPETGKAKANVDEEEETEEEVPELIRKKSRTDDQAET